MLVYTNLILRNHEPRYIWKHNPQKIIIWRHFLQSRDIAIEFRGTLDVYRIALEIRVNPPWRADYVDHRWHTSTKAINTRWRHYVFRPYDVTVRRPTVAFPAGLQFWIPFWVRRMGIQLKCTKTHNSTLSFPRFVKNVGAMFTLWRHVPLSWHVMAIVMTKAKCQQSSNLINLPRERDMAEPCLCYLLVFIVW